MTISRSLMERQLRAGGGIMTLEEPRQGYFLGKLVRKAKRAVKKIVKSQTAFDEKLKEIKHNQDDNDDDIFGR